MSLCTVDDFSYWRSLWELVQLRERQEEPKAVVKICDPIDNFDILSPSAVTTFDYLREIFASVPEGPRFRGLGLILRLVALSLRDLDLALMGRR